MTTDLSEDKTTCELEVSTSPWDTFAFGVNAGTIEKFYLHNKQYAPHAELRALSRWISDNNISLISARLPEDRIYESILLEKFGSNVIEMNLHPTIRELQNRNYSSSRFVVNVATSEDRDLLSSQVSKSFSYERFHADPRIDNNKASLRYQNWFTSSFDSEERQVLTVNTKDNEKVAFFVTEQRNEEQVHWLLTAVLPKYQGKGIGQSIWESVLCFHKEQKVHRITTTISARNTPVLNLYSKLSFQFDSPEISLHWVDQNLLLGSN